MNYFYVFAVGALGWLFVALFFAAITYFWERKAFLKQRRKIEAVALKVKEQELQLQEAYLNIDKKLKDLKEEDLGYDA